MDAYLDVKMHSLPPKNPGASSVAPPGNAIGPMNFATSPQPQKEGHSEIAIRSNEFATSPQTKKEGQKD